MLCRLAKGALIIVISGGVVGCETKAGTGALAGGAGGAAVGGIIGSFSHARAGEGAAIGAAVGAIGGALVGHAMDEQDHAYDDRQIHEAYAARDYHYADPHAVSKNDIVYWTHRGMSDDIIIDRIERSGTVFHLTAADENGLRDRGVSDAVIQVMEDTAHR